MGDGSTGDSGGEALNHEFAGTYDGRVSDCINCDAVLVHLIDDLVNYATKANRILDDIFEGNKPSHGHIATVSRRLQVSLDAMRCAPMEVFAMEGER